jgi:hypothetical protein
MSTLVIQTDSQDHIERFSKLAKSPGDNISKLNYNTLKDILLAADIEDGISSGLLSAKEKEDFLKEIESDSKNEC